MRLHHPTHGDAVEGTTTVFTRSDNGEKFVAGYWRSGYANLPASEVTIVDRFTELAATLEAEGRTVIPENEVALALDSARVYAYVLVPGNDTPQPVRVHSLETMIRGKADGWGFVLFYVGLGYVPIGRA